MLDVVCFGEFSVVCEDAGGFADGAELVDGRCFVTLQFTVAV